MTTDDGAGDDAYWRRPDPDAPGGVSGPPRASGPGIPDESTGPDGSAGAGPVGYSGPPVGSPPPPSWRPPVVVNPAPPGTLPPQDLAALDGAERNARTVTYGVGMIAAAVMIILTCLLCSRLVF
ncbi:translation initiation factor 2 [Solwaraspora sp. WMMD937]|uniref:translation initiation factor 2 n=1 Tax=Solwaraspora sp. WMMD937 TaxID=3016090 RepID=UPI00249A5955|nr:translation initiation factor 2 [Solwaraspora sp. WMMD937]WFE22000.1 translation initiation factor 2 [Solwaraspora sp. WMMD937]